MPAAPNYEDSRGTITDLLGPVDSVTEIFTKAGAIRGNHRHNLTTQWTKVLAGRLLVTDEGGHEAMLNPGDLWIDPSGIGHAWQALEDCTVLVFTSGPRSGSNYELDTERLAKPLLP